MRRDDDVVPPQLQKLTLRLERKRGRLPPIEDVDAKSETEPGSGRARLT